MFSLIRGTSRAALNYLETILHSFFLPYDITQTRWVTFGMVMSGVLGGMMVGYFLDIGGLNCNGTAYERTRAHSRRVGGISVLLAAIGAFGVLAVGSVVLILQQNKSISERMDDYHSHKHGYFALFYTACALALLFGCGAAGVVVFAFEHSVKQQQHVRF